MHEADRGKNSSEIDFAAEPKNVAIESVEKSFFTENLLEWKFNSFSLASL